MPTEEEIIARRFRAIHMPHRRREAENETDGAPTKVQPGELVYGAPENKLYIGQDDGTVLVVAGQEDDDSNYVESNPTNIGGALQIANIVKMSQADYDALVTKDESTLYIIDG